MSLWYNRETNNTALAGDASTIAPYVRFATLDHVEYGTRAGSGATRESSHRHTTGTAGADGIRPVHHRKLRNA